MYKDKTHGLKPLCLQGIFNYQLSYTVWINLHTCGIDHYSLLVNHSILLRNLLNENAKLKYKEKELLEKLEAQQKGFDTKQTVSLVKGIL